MFESFSSRANQSAVDKLIQLATGKKAPAQAEEERDAPESMEQPREPAATAASVEPPSAAEPAADPPAEFPAEVAADPPAEAPAEVAPAIENPVSETPVEERPQVADLLKSLANGPERAAEEPVDERPFYEPPAEPQVEAAPEPAAAEPSPPAEPANEPVAEGAWVEEPGLDPQSAFAPVEAPAEAVDERPFYEPPAEPPVDETPGEPVAAEPAMPEPVASEPAVPESAAPDPDAAEPPSPPPAEPVRAPVVEQAKPVEASGAETAPAAVPVEAEKPVAETVTAAAAVGTGEAKEAAPDNAHPRATTSTADRGDKVVRAEKADDEPFNLEKFRQRQAERRQRRGTDILPSPDETTFLRSRYRDSPRDDITEDELKTLSRDPMWKTLIQFKGWLPVVTRILPLLDLAGRRASSENSEEIKDSVDGLLISNRDMRTTLQNQTVELKRVEEEIARLREASDKSAFEQNAISEDVRGIQKLMKNAFLYLGILLGLMVVAVGYMAFLVFTYLNHPVH